MKMLKKQKSVIKPFKPNNTLAPWLNRNILASATQKAIQKPKS